MAAAAAAAAPPPPSSPSTLPPPPSLLPSKGLGLGRSRAAGDDLMGAADAVTGPQRGPPVLVLPLMVPRLRAAKTTCHSTASPPLAPVHLCQRRMRPPLPSARARRLGAWFVCIAPRQGTGERARDASIRDVSRFERGQAIFEC